MENIYITGHQNPDLDSLCSAYSYAYLKNLTDPDHHYVAVRCGHISDTIRKQFDLLDIESPLYMKDVLPKVSDVMLQSENRIDASIPIYDLIRLYSNEKPSVYPVFNGEDYVGLLSVDDITSWFLSDNAGDFPSYDFPRDNIPPVIEGTLLHKGTAGTFHASLVAGSASEDFFRQTLKARPDSLIVMPYRPDYLEYAIGQKVPAIVLSACQEAPEIDCTGYEGSIFSTALDTAETLRRLRMCPAVTSLMRTQAEPLQVTDLYDDAKTALSESKLRGLSVFRDDKWAGFVTRRCFLKRPSYKVILVDHNERKQSIRGIEGAEVLEIIDHHRLDAPKTDLPIFIDAEPVGSTCTIVYQQFIRHGITPTPKIARTLLAGIISDTVVLKSPTTTVIDRTSAGALAAICGEFDLYSFGEKLFSQTETLATMDPATAINNDFKQYEQGAFKFGIGQCETTTLENVGDYAERYIDALITKQQGEGLDWAMLMVTNVIQGRSVLLTTPCKYTKKLPYAEMQAGLYAMPEVMSRKKQLLPEVLHALD